MSIKERLDSRHPEDSLQLRGQAEIPQCWCGQQNKPSAGRFDGPEAREDDEQDDAENDTFSFVKKQKTKKHLRFYLVCFASKGFIWKDGLF